MMRQRMRDIRQSRRRSATPSSQLRQHARLCRDPGRRLPERTNDDTTGAPQQLAQPPGVRRLLHDRHVRILCRATPAAIGLPA